MQEERGGVWEKQAASARVAGALGRSSLSLGLHVRLSSSPELIYPQPSFRLSSSQSTSLVTTLSTAQVVHICPTNTGAYLTATRCYSRPHRRRFPVFQMPTTSCPSRIHRPRLEGVPHVSAKEGTRGYCFYYPHQARSRQCKASLYSFSLSPHKGTYHSGFCQLSERSILVHLRVQPG